MKQLGYFDNRPGPIIPPKNTYAALYLDDSVQPVTIKASDPRERAEMLAFYSKISTVLKDISKFKTGGIREKLQTFEAIVKLLFQLESYTFYVYLGGESYAKMQLNQTEPFRLAIGDIGRVFD